MLFTFYVIDADNSHQEDSEDEFENDLALVIQGKILISFLKYNIFSKLLVLIMYLDKRERIDMFKENAEKLVSIHQNL